MLSERFKIFTYRDRHDIPELPGTYAWFFPLYLLKDYQTAQQIADMYRKVFALDSKFDGESLLKENEYLEDRHTRSWQSVSIKTEVIIAPGGRLPDDCDLIWKRVQADPIKKAAFEEALITASLFMPPLYIGKSNNLHARYNDHIKKSGFNERFKKFAKMQNLPIATHDLLFCCLSVDSESEKIMTEESEEQDGIKGMNYLLEHILMKSARPPFSKQ